MAKTKSATTETAVETTAAQTATNTAPKRARRTLTPEQRARMNERSDRMFQAQRRELMEYLKFSPRGVGDRVRQQRFMNLVSLILRNISRLDDVQVIVGDNFSRRMSEVARNSVNITKQADEAYSYGDGDREAILSATKEIESLKSEILKSINDFNSKISSVRAKLDKASN